VKPGESFVYDFVLRDAGLFWYPPAPHVGAQVGFGLYGRCWSRIRTTAWAWPTRSRWC
jgi:hypothetical protein